MSSSVVLSTAGPKRAPPSGGGTIVCGAARLTHDQLGQRARRVATGLADMGVSAGDRVALLLRNAVEFLEISLGTSLLGAYPVPINWHLQRGEVRAILQDCTPSVIFVHDNLVDRLPDGKDWDVPVLSVQSSEQINRLYATEPCSLQVGLTLYDQWRDRQSPWPGAPRLAPVSLMYTGGSTGTPKGVQREPPTAAQQAEMRKLRFRLYDLDSEGRALVCGPLYHGIPNHFALFCAAEAAHLEIMPKFDAVEFLETIEREQITTIALTPIILVRLLHLPAEQRRRYDLSSLRCLLHGGGPCAPEVKRAIHAWLGPIVREYYGGTETGPLTACDAREWEARPGTCGRVMPEATVNIIGEDGARAAAGQPGQVYGRLRCFPEFTYRNAPEKRQAAALGDLFATGDIGYLDAEGFLFLCDRVNDMIISGGVNIYPAEIEGELFALPGVQDCVVVGAPDSEFGECVIAIACGRDLDGEGLRQGLRGRIANFKIPKKIFIVDDLRRDSSGKVQRKYWREEYASRFHSR